MIFRRTIRTPIFLAALVAALLLPPLALAFPPKKPYDPRPLMAELIKKHTTDRYTFVVMGDIQGGPAFPGVAARVEAIKPDFVLLTGDIVQKGAPGLYDGFERIFGSFMRKVPTWPCMGNHDSHGLGEGGFRQFWGIGPRYTFDFRNARFICLKALWGTNLDKADMDWLEKQLAEGRKAGKLMFVYHHCPAYTVGGRKSDAIPGKPTPFTRLLSTYGAVAAFSGHEHMYYRTRREGVTFITQGLAGAGVYFLGRTAEAVKGDAYYGASGDTFILHTSAGQDKEMKRTFMVTVITVDASKVTGKMVAADGQVVDEFVLHEAK